MANFDIFITLLLSKYFTAIVRLIIFKYTQYISKLFFDYFHIGYFLLKLCKKIKKSSTFSERNVKRYQTKAKDVSIQQLKYVKFCGQLVALIGFELTQHISTHLRTCTSNFSTKTSAATETLRRRHRAASAAAAVDSCWVCQSDCSTSSSCSMSHILLRDETRARPRDVGRDQVSCWPLTGRAH